MEGERAELAGGWGKRNGAGVWWVRGAGLGTEGRGCKRGRCFEHSKTYACTLAFKAENTATSSLDPAP